MDDLRFRNRYRIPSARYPGWDYRWAGVYSVTICTQERMRCLGDVVEGQVSLSPLGKVVADEWLKIPLRHPRTVLDEWMVMPDHMHGLLIFQGQAQPAGSRDSKHLLAQSLGAVINHFKKEATRRIRWDLKRPDFAWQDRFHDTIVRTPSALDRLRAYIRNNPAEWNP